MRPIARLARSMTLVGALLGAACTTLPQPRARVSLEATSIDWQRFAPAAFERARSEDKLVLVDVGIEGCTACRWMYERTYRNSDVVRHIRDHFVAVSVDADVEPDLGARYRPWGWPATIILTPAGRQIAAYRGNMAPSDFLAVLDELVRRQRAGNLDAADAPTPPRAPTPLRDLCARGFEVIDRGMDREHGGWPSDGGVQFVDGDDVEEALLRARVAGDAGQRAHALRTLDGWARLLDPVWGGVFIAARRSDFSGPIVEKRLLHEAAALRGFAAAYAVTRDARWLDRARLVDRYLRDFLLAPDGTFYATQEDAAPNLPDGMSPSRYYELGDADRRRYGVPPIDHAVYTDQNGVLIAAYAALYEASGDAGALAMATRAADALLAARLQSDGHVSQAAPSASLTADERKRAFAPRDAIFLAPQVELGRALVALHRATGDPRWLAAARRIAGAMRARLEDRAAAGFFASEPTGAGEVFAPDKPMLENVAAVRFLFALSIDARDEEVAKSAERALSALAAYARPTPALLLAIQEVSLGPVEMSVVGSRGDPAADEMFRAAVRVYEPRKALHFDTAGRYPNRGEAALYVCTRDACSSPVHDPSEIAATAARFARTTSGACP